LVGVTDDSHRAELVTRVTRDASGVTVAVEGELDLGTSPRLVAQAAVIDDQPGRQLTVDLSGVGFCDSAGISALLHLRQQCDHAGWVLRVVGPQPAVRRVLVDFTGLGTYLNIA